MTGRKKKKKKTTKIRPKRKKRIGELNKVEVLKTWVCGSCCYHRQSGGCR